MLRHVIAVTVELAIAYVLSVPDVMDYCYFVSRLLASDEIGRRDDTRNSPTYQTTRVRVYLLIIGRTE